MMSATVSYRLLVIDDEPDLRTLYELTLLREGYEVETASSVEDAWQHLQEQSYNAIITDMRLPDGTGLDLLRRMEQAGRSEKALVITAYGSAENAVESLKAGAFDYLTKPVDLKQFRAIVAAALGRMPAAKATGPRLQALTQNAAGLPASSAEKKPISSGHQFTGLAPELEAPASVPLSATLQRMRGDSAAMQQVRELIRKVATSMAPVWIFGESGTGKELVARAIHEVSTRAGGPFIAVNCGAIPEQLLEAEFFGYRKGAFTGAQEDREGFFQAARGGTLFLDEIGDLPLSMQSKLLRAIQERAIRPIGTAHEISVDIRIVSATHKDLAQEVQAGRFRQDLYYRLNVIQISLPALRERRADLPEICQVVLEKITQESRLAKRPHLSAGALERLSSYDFPGNVRELENLLHRAVALSGGASIGVEDLGLPLLAQERVAHPPEPVSQLSWIKPESLPPAQGIWHASQLENGSANHGLDSLSGVSSSLAPLSDPAESSLCPAEIPADLAVYLDSVERTILLRALDQHRYNRTAAGASLGLSLRQMRYRMARLGIQTRTNDEDSEESI